jgi:crotonobetainyl-CoA:carnitine CoA-transferase CaiB-like acyl-CoA transferase
MTSQIPLEGVVVLEFSQYLSGPLAGLRLADLGARVIKIERPVTGEAGRRLAIKDLWVDDSSLLFHTINRNKESFAADLKDKADLDKVKLLVKKADVIIHNFRPGVMEKIGLNYDAIKEINPQIIYGEITGYGKKGPWKDKPGQDLLIQSLSGLVFTSGNEGQPPVPFGLAIADMICGNHLVQGIIAALCRRQITKAGALIEVSLLESILDFQFELLTTYYNGGREVQRSRVHNAHPLLSAPYGIYKTADGYLAIAMTPIRKLGAVLGCDALDRYDDRNAFRLRDEIKRLIASTMTRQSNQYWMDRFIAEDIWAIPVMNWNEMVEHEVYKTVGMEQQFSSGGKLVTTTRCPIRFNDEIMYSDRGAPSPGEHTKVVSRDLQINNTP